MPGVLCALRVHAMSERFDRLILVRRLDHVQVMVSHRDKVMIAHNDTAGRAGIEHFSLVELLAVPVDAAVVLAWAW